MNYLLLIALTTAILVPTPSQSDTNHFGTGGVFELDLGDSEIPLTPKQEREQKLSDGWESEVRPQYREEERGASFKGESFESTRIQDEPKLYT